MVNSVHGLTDKNIVLDFKWEPNAAITNPESGSATTEMMTFAGQKRLIAGQTSGHWQARIVSKVCELLELPENWNSYGAPRIRQDTAMFAIVVLETIMNAGTPLPLIVPTARGGIQLEWHENDIDFEIDVIRPYYCEYTYHDERDPQVQLSGEFEGQLLELQQPLAELTKRAAEEMYRLRRA